MYVVLFVLWLILNGNITLEIVVLGLVICAVLYWFLQKFLGYSMHRERLIFSQIGKIIKYIGLLIVEIIKANQDTVKMILNFEKEPEPVLAEFDARVKTDVGRTLLANSITMTPGTITVLTGNNRFVVHSLDQSFAEGIDESLFVEQICQMEDAVRKEE